MRNDLRRKVVRLAYYKPELRRDLLPLIHKEGFDVSDAVKARWREDAYLEDIDQAVRDIGVQLSLHQRFGPFFKKVKTHYSTHQDDTALHGTITFSGPGVRKLSGMHITRALDSILNHIEREVPLVSFEQVWWEREELKISFHMKEL